MSKHGAKCECYAVLNKKDPRYDIWKQVDPEAKIPLKNPLTHEHPHFKGVICYEGDPSRLTEQQRKLIIELMSEKFKQPKEHIAEGLEKGIMPVRVDNTNLCICELHCRCML